MRSPALSLPRSHVMLALQAANNETGVLQPVPAAAEIIHAAGGYLICDAVQAAGKSACRFQSLGSRRNCAFGA